jgi:hypothetical protein
MKNLDEKSRNVHEKKSNTRKVGLSLKKMYTRKAGLSMKKHLGRNVSL